jgi:hypothetical protein
MAETFGSLLDTAVRRFDAACARHAQRSPVGPADSRMLAARRRLLVERAFAADWIVPEERLRRVEAAMGELDVALDPVEEALRLDRFAFLVLDALERRSPDRLTRDTLDVPLLVESL